MTHTAVGHRGTRDGQESATGSHSGTDREPSASESSAPGQKAPVDGRPLRYTLCTTLRCNLACTYCYVRKNGATMSPETARRAVDFLYRLAPPSRPVEFGFFGGEPLLELPLLGAAVGHIENHPAWDPARVSLSLTTNGTIFTAGITEFLRHHAFKVCISCDGPPSVHDRLRLSAGGVGTSAVVERNLRAARDALPQVLVNAVVHPATVRRLPETVEYLSGLGLRQIFLNHDYSAPWTAEDAEILGAAYEAVADRYIAWYLAGTPHYVSLIDNKIAVLIRGGYLPEERCQMGTGELAVAPDGTLFPCERLVGAGTSGDHAVGSLDRGLDLSRLLGRCIRDGPTNSQCRECSLRDSCMNWCGCSNAFMTGHYDRVGPFLCASERAAIRTALRVFSTLERRLGPVFLKHLAGAPHWNSRSENPMAPNPPSPPAA